MTFVKKKQRQIRLTVSENNFDKIERITEYFGGEPIGKILFADITDLINKKSLEIPATFIPNKK